MISLQNKIYHICKVIFLLSFNLYITFAETAPELESSATPLMLTGIPGTDFALTRDFLVMQDDQINVINSFKNQNIEMEDNPIILPSITEDANKENNNLVLSECDREIQPIIKEPLSTEKKKIVEKKDIRRSKRHIIDKKDFCNYNIYSKHIMNKYIITLFSSLYIR